MESTLGEVSDGGSAQRAYLLAIDPATGADRTEVLRKALLRYCGQDTLGLVRIVHFLSGHERCASVKDMCLKDTTAAPHGHLLQRCGSPTSIGVVRTLTGANLPHALARGPKRAPNIPVTR
jgi:hypothetical protein